ncbi:gluconate 2-dehydrogenase subunit 3 family protein [Aquimarina sp. U1-2]|uniref:gluconate 2-dehydrogenase subunit 3 family protein n=1 Tax=Aquimarina sp. U1-2 TaxID=2823141 RepID=UPI001AEC8D82|nr:gluconate 2-dehydrogenase subunit 3 family protein [Aquimarina sp. U1-2]MBP2834019.1 gluconate 2-dehydrogenase subunit 3 family protein [Aquimarina sp. U1-2]
MINRRQALKNIGLSVGYIAAAPTILSVLQSCTSEIKLNWTPQLLSEDEAKVMDQLVDLIIPETDIPGAKSLNVPMFIDKFMNQVAKKEEAEMFKKSAGFVLDELQINEDKPVKEVKIEEYEALLSKYLKSTKEQQKTYQREIAQIKGLRDFENLPTEVNIFSFLNAVRDLSIWGFKTSKEIGENVLAYAPVPGEQIGCDSVQNLTGGKAWSL